LVSLLYFSGMFVRKKKNKSGVVSIQIIDISSGIYELYRTIGSSKEPAEIERIYREGKREIESITGQQKLPFDYEKEKKLIDILFNGIEDFKLTGPELLLGKLFDEIGFDKIPDELFRHLVIARLVYPVSKLKTVDHIFKYKVIIIEAEKVYRYLDKLQTQQMQLVQQISYQHTLKILDNYISMVFYDVPTLYFEAADEDDFRQTGFSKDGKHQQPQIVLGLLVSSGGYPLAYELFEGSKFEGQTMIPFIETFKEKNKLEKLIAVADAGLLSNKNIEALCEKNYKFILGARIKNETWQAQQHLLSLELADGGSSIIDKGNGQKLIVSYSDGRPKNDAFNRKRGLQKLEKALASGKLSKKHINNKGL
jgi:hypothetical protein